MCLYPAFGVVRHQRDEGGRHRSISSTSAFPPIKTKEYIARFSIPYTYMFSKLVRDTLKMTS
jgi:hypothetical protein